MNRTLLYLTVLASPLSAASQDLGEHFGSFAAGDNLGYGGTTDAATQALADSGALDQCRARDTGCEILARFGEGVCFAVAIAEPVEALGWATAPELQQARTGAVQQCIDYGGGRACRVTDADCNSERVDAGAVAGAGAPQQIPAESQQQVPEQVSIGARCDENNSGLRDCWAEVPGHSGCYVWFPRRPPAGGFGLVYYGRPLTMFAWEGQCLDGFAHGHWLLTLDPEFRDPPSREIVQGSFVQGKMHGRWDSRQTREDPDFAFSNREIQYDNGQMHGVGRSSRLWYGDVQEFEWRFVNGELQD